MNTGTRCSATSAGWGFGSTGKRANSPLCRGSLFSVWSWTRSTSPLSPTALAYQLPRDASSVACSAPLQIAATQACTGPYGEHCDRCVYQPPRWSTLPLHVTTRPPSPPLESEASEVGEHVADKLSRQPALPGEWRLHPETVQLIWRCFGDTSHCQLFYSLSEGTLGTDALAHSWPRGLHKYAFPPVSLPPVSLLAQTLCKGSLRRDLLAQRGGTIWHPRPDLWNLHVCSPDGTWRF